ncbi:MAG: aspartate carbamoyltransferase catalytic subunit [Clostridia bacterium]|jgi:aspartate carbamoyltransferase catalytic subunit|nr:aspartate carbamoyltransferase catalytic subunit [Clostridia bacterium]
MLLQSKDVLGLQYMPSEEISYIIESAATMKELLMQSAKKMPHLQGKSIVSLFYENSTRTRMSFELAGKYLGATVSNLGVSTSSVQKGETLLDTGKTLEAMGTDIVIIRHPLAGAPKFLGDNFSGSVLNAGDGMHEHPTQGLLDMFTMKEKFGELKGLNVTIIGDIMHSRVARSNIWGLTKLGANVTICGMDTMMPCAIERTGVTVSNNLIESVKDADVVMALRIQKERQKGGLLPSNREYHTFFGINDDVIDKCKKGVMIMHPGPVNRGVELSSAVMDADFSVIDTQVTNGVAVRMALLYILTRSKNNEA